MAKAAYDLYGTLTKEGDYVFLTGYRRYGKILDDSIVCANGDTYYKFYFCCRKVNLHQQRLCGKISSDEYHKLLEL